MHRDTIVDTLEAIWEGLISEQCESIGQVVVVSLHLAQHCTIRVLIVFNSSCKCFATPLCCVESVPH